MATSDERATGDWLRREPLIRRFEDAWRRGPPPAIADYLPVEETDRRPVLTELVHADLEYRLKTGASVRVEDYVARYAELRDDPQALLDLVLAEYELRRRQEPGLRLQDYRERFPQLAARLNEYDKQTPRAYAPRLARAGECDNIEDTPTAAQTLPLLPSIPGYEVLGLVARGGMGTVYLARQTPTSTAIPGPATGSRR